MIKGINHITIAVKNLENSFLFYNFILGFKPLLKHSKGAYLLAGDLWFCLELDSEDRTQALTADSHFSFSVELDDFPKLSEKIKKSGALIWKENKSEGESLYFLDPDGYKLEIHVGDWKSRLQSMRESPWGEGLVFYP
jgi:glutathione S-transferase fosA5